ncbi:hypothetical protein ACWD00_07265 [Streptomyces viridiviolaceus]
MIERPYDGASVVGIDLSEAPLPTTLGDDRTPRTYAPEWCPAT